VRLRLPGKRNRPPVVRVLVVGLGNPGSQYAGTRHNVGFEVVDALRKRLGAVRLGKKCQARLWLAGEWLLAQPQTFMNRSGLAVRLLCQTRHLEPEQVLVVADEVNLPVGKVRLRRTGSAGGHNGLKSLIAELGSTAFPRLRIGVGRPAAGEDLVEHVLSPPSAEERRVIDEAETRAVDCVETFLREGLEAAMNQSNE